uniref:Uncharacterized protein n=1 Tax=Populus alba TaxID=43335 RepID=A0A4U5NPV8_POPAL|nr:hypothetical protein D5086_0000245590 [Populus alba]
MEKKKRETAAERRKGKRNGRGGRCPEWQRRRETAVVAAPVLLAGKEKKMGERRGGLRGRLRGKKTCDGAVGVGCEWESVKGEMAAVWLVFVAGGCRKQKIPTRGGDCVWIFREGAADGSVADLCWGAGRESVDGAAGSLGFVQSAAVGGRWICGRLVLGAASPLLLKEPPKKRLLRGKFRMEGGPSLVADGEEEKGDRSREEKGETKWSGGEVPRMAEKERNGCGGCSGFVGWKREENGGTTWRIEGTAEREEDL